MWVSSVYTVHDEIKDKHFELELASVGKGKSKKEHHK